MKTFTYVELTLVTLMCICIVMAWLNAALKGAAFKQHSRKKLVGWTLSILLGWLALIGILAQIGFLAVWKSVPPRVPLVPLAALLTVIALNRTAIFKKLVLATPRYWPVAFQSFRIGVELAFWGLFVSGGAPIQVTFEGRNFDVIVGLTAPLVAIAIRKLNLRPKFVIGWNVLGLGILLNTIITTLTSTPGPIFMNWPAPFTAFATWPFAWIPGFLAPLAICLHIFSIRQNLALQKSLEGSAV